MKFIYFFFSFIIINVNAFSQSVNGELDNVILAQADKMGKAFISKDYDAFLLYTHPAIVDMMGGREKMVAETKKSFEEIEATGVVFKEVRFGQPSQIIISENELQCTFPEMIDMTVPGGRLTANSTLIAISQDAGQNWYFVDASGNNIKQMQKLLPTLSSKLIIPEKQEPVYVNDDTTAGE